MENGEIMNKEEQIKRIANALWHYPDPREFNNYNLVEALVREAFDNIQSAESKTGKWIENVVRWGNAITTVHGYRCSECGALNLCKDKFCPNCGKDMKVGNKE